MFSCFKRNNSTINIKKDINNFKIPDKLHKIFLKNIKNNNNIFDIQCYEPEELIKGNKSKIYKLKINNNFYTCKKYLKNENDYDNKLINNEINILKKINGMKYLPFFCTHIINNNSTFIFYNYIEGKDLYESINKDYKIIKASHNLLDIIYNILIALFELFKANFVHLDIKPENIIICSYNPVVLKLIDLECAHDIRKTKLEREVGTIGYTAPEILLYRRYYYNSDIWSLGCIIYVLMTRKELFSSTNFLDYRLKIKNFNGLDELDYEKYYFNIFSSEMYDLLKKMLEPFHITRFTIKKVLKSNLFKTFIHEKH